MKRLKPNAYVMYPLGTSSKATNIPV